MKNSPSFDGRTFRVETLAPTGLNYRYLTWVSLDRQEGRATPLLFFTNQDDRAAGAKQHAWVYIVSEGQFKPVPHDVVDGESSHYRYRCAVMQQSDKHGARYDYVVYYTGDSLEWLREAPPADAADPAVGN